MSLFRDPKKTTTITLKDLFSISEESLYLKEMSDQVDVKQHSIEYKNNNNDEFILNISNISNYNHPEFNLLNIVKFAHKNNNELKSIIQGFFIHLKKVADPEEKKKYLNQFFGESTYQELSQINSDLTKSIILGLCDYNIILKDPNRVILEFADILAERCAQYPEALLQEGDLFAGLSDDYFFYHTLPRSKDLDTNQVEGYWQDEHVNKNIFAVVEHSLKKGEPITSDVFTPELLADIKKLVLDKEKPTEKKRYPIPEPSPWPNKEKFLSYLRAFEEVANFLGLYKTRGLAILRLRVKDERIINDLLLQKIKIGGNAGPARKRFPTDTNDCWEFYFEDKDRNINFCWTQALSTYVALYNIVPSKAFMECINATVPFLRGAYYEATLRLREYLAIHPLELTSSVEESRLRPAK